MELALTQQDLLDLLDRLLPSSYLEPLKDVGPGYELYQALAKIHARNSVAVDRFDDGVHILEAQGGALARVTVEFYRATATQMAGVVKAGTQVKTNSRNLIFITDTDAVFGDADLGPVQVTATAITIGYDWNVPGPVTAADGEILPGEIDTVWRFIQVAGATSPAGDGSPFWDSSILVQQVNDATGGRDAVLDQLGDDRGIPRRVGEGDLEYRQRVRTLPDTVSPGAIRRFVQTLINRYNGAQFEFVETYFPTYQDCWDATSLDTGDSDPNLFVFDDPRGPNPFRNRWYSEEDSRGAFIIVVPLLQPIYEFGCAYDDINITESDCVSPQTGGFRALVAYDVPVSSDPVLQGCYDGFDTGSQALYAGIYEQLQQIKAGGVFTTLELQGS